MLGDATNLLVQTKEGCAHAAAAFRKIVLKEVERASKRSKMRAGWTIAIGLLLICTWTGLIFVRHRVPRRRLIGLALDVICVALAIGAEASFRTSSFSISPSREKPFLNDAFVTIGAHELEYWFAPYVTARWFLSENERCVDEFFVASGFVTDGQFDETKFEKLRTVATLVLESYTPSALYSVSRAFCAISVLLIVSSFISALTAFCAKSVPLRDVEAAVPSLSIRLQRTLQLERQNAAAPGIPSEHAVRFFERFIEKVQPPTEGAVLGDSQQSIECCICLEGMLREIAALSACSHTFHHRCIINWLVSSNEHCCPICREPLRLSTTPYRAEDDDDENGVEQHQLVEVPLHNELERTPSTVHMHR